MAEETGFVDGEVFEQTTEFLLALVADQEAVVGVERVGAALAEPAQQPVLEEVGATLVEVHAALLVDERLQQLQFRLGQYWSWCGSGCAHALSRPRRSVASFQWSVISLDHTPHTHHRCHDFEPQTTGQ